MPTSREIHRVRRARRIARLLLEHRGREVARRIAPFWTPNRKLRRLPVRSAMDGDWWYRRIDLPAEREHARWVAEMTTKNREPTSLLPGLATSYDRIEAVLHFTRTR